MVNISPAAAKIMASPSWPRERVGADCIDRFDFLVPIFKKKEENCKEPEMHNMFGFHMDGSSWNRVSIVLLKLRTNNVLYKMSRTKC